jgi:hypothetical protein
MRTISVGCATIKAQRFQWIAAPHEIANPRDCAAVRGFFVAADEVRLKLRRQQIIGLRPSPSVAFVLISELVMAGATAR